MEADEYASVVFILLCKEKGVPPTPRPYFPKEYVDTSIPDYDDLGVGDLKKAASKIANRRTKWYKDVRKNFRFSRDTNGMIVGLERKKSRNVLDNGMGENGACTFPSSLSTLNPF